MSRPIKHHTKADIALQDGTTHNLGTSRMGMIRSYINVFSSASVTIVASLFLSTSTLASDEKYIDLFISGDCHRAWLEAWPKAKEGKTRALEVLSEISLTIGISPLAAGEGSLFYFKELGLRGISEESTVLKDVLPQYLRSEEVPQPGGRRVAECLQGGNYDKCIAVAEERSVILRFDDLVRSIEKNLDVNSDVFCLEERM